MPRKANPEAIIVGYFQAAPIETAQAVLNIVAQVVKDRAPKPKKPRKKTADDQAAGES